MNARTDLQGRKRNARNRIPAVLLCLVIVAGLFLAGCSALKEAPDSSKKTESSEAESSRKTSDSRKESEETSGENSKPVPDTGEQTQTDVPKAQIDPALTGKWGYHDKATDVDLVWEFKADGTGSYYGNGMTLPIASYVATKTPFTQYSEDGFLLTVYWAEITETMGDTVVTTQMDPTEYGYIVDGNTLRIVFSRDIADHYTDFTRE